jgi:hypothetical protein
MEFAEERVADAVCVVGKSSILGDKRLTRILRNIFRESNFRVGQEIWPTRSTFVEPNWRDGPQKCTSWRRRA